MTCHHWVGDWKIPAEKRQEVETLLTKHDLEGIFDIQEADKHPEFLWVSQQVGNVANSTPQNIEEFLEELAKVLEHTACDGQANKVETDEGDGGFTVLAGGSVYDEDGAIITLPPEYAGEGGPVLLDALLIPLPGDGTVTLEGEGGKESEPLRQAIVYGFSIHERKRKGVPNGIH